MIKKPLLIAIFFAYFSGSVNAATAIDYSGNCSYKNATGRIAYSGPCQLNFGIVGMTENVRYILQFQKSNVEIFSFPKNNLCTANAIPCIFKHVSGSKRIRVVTGENEVFEFSAPESDSM